MLRIPADKFAHAVEALMIAARTCTDQQGLRIRTDTPRLHRDDTRVPERAGTADSDVNPLRDFNDYQRIKAITLGAIVALVNGPAHVDDEHHFSAAELREIGFGVPEKRA